MTVDLLTRRSVSLAPSTLNREAGTVEVTLSTGASVARAGFTERLAIGPENVEAAARVPLLDAHRQGSIRDVLGRVSNIRHEPGRIVATLTVTDPSALAAIERGDVSGVSIGYRVTAWREGKDPATGARIRTATRWALLEASLVPVPADSGATIRSSIMAEAEAETVTIETPEPVTENRASGIRALSRSANLSSEWADDQIDSGATLLEARAAALEATLARPNVVIRTQQAAAPSEANHQENREIAIAHRMAPSAVPLTEGAAIYQHYTLKDHAREMLMQRGQSVTGLSPQQIFTRSLGGLHTTGDFAGLLTGAGARTLAQPYQAALSALKQLFLSSIAVDFRPKTRLSLSEMPTLLKVNEGGEIKYGTRGETAESYKIDTWARIFAVSYQAMVNDDLGAFADWNGAMASAAAELENGLRASLLTQGNGLGPVMSDGKRLFHADHGNMVIQVGGDPLDVAALAEARLAMRLQRAADGVTPLGLVPKYLLVGPALETAAEQVLAVLAAATPEGVNPFSGKLTLLVEPRLSGADWYLFADPASRPVFEESHLASAPGPVMDSRAGFDVLGMEFRVVDSYGCGALDWRGAFYHRTA